MFRVRDRLARLEESKKGMMEGRKEGGVGLGGCGQTVRQDKSRLRLQMTSVSVVVIDCTQPLVIHNSFQMSNDVISPLYSPRLPNLAPVSRLTTRSRLLVDQDGAKVSSEDAGDY